MIRQIFGAPPLSRSGLRLLWAMLALGAVGRVAVAFATLGVGPDIDAYVRVWAALQERPLELYALTTDEFPRWPYPSGFALWIAVSGWLNDLTGLRFDGLVQLAPIAADLALAWMVQAFLGQRGASERTRLVAAALVVFGPSFFFISGYHGQIDALAILPPLLALWYWDRAGPERNTVVAGVLIGIGGAIKFPALIFLLALLPTARSIRAGAVLLTSAAGVVLLTLAPFLLANFDATSEAIRAHKGLPGFGGISLLLQPDLAGAWLGTKPGTEMSSLSEELWDRAGVIAGSVAIAIGALATKWRLAPVSAATLLFLGVYAFGVNFAFQYLVAGLAVFLLAGHLRAVAGLQAAVLIPTVLLYVRERRDLPLHDVYTPIMLAVWVAFVVAFVLTLVRLRGEKQPGPARLERGAADLP